jgi:hypothetical protein|nr:MAG TPA: protein of unknown function (DUF4494) [Caudoviricetes sp.]DAY73315.1 MAG TPA: protein of unknown function (DUF4494) [Caudoviricetes sp.]
MYYEVTLKVTKQDNKGKDKEVKESFLVENAELWSEVEQRGLELYNSEADIVAMKRSSVIEVVNEKKEDTPIFKAKLISTYVDEKGKEKEKSWVVALFAADMNEANKKMQEYIKQGMEDLTLREIKQTNLLEII